MSWASDAPVGCVLVLAFDLVFARGPVRQGRYTKDGEERFTVDLISTDFSRLAKPNGEATSEAPSDHDIPY